MIVKSAAGPVDLSRPESVRAGMVFWVDGAPWIATLHDEHLGWGNGGVWCGSPGRDFAFLGCNPAHATRADCERFGLAPDVDAGAHGFARTRDGFAEDVHFMRGCGVVWERLGDRQSRRVDPGAVAPGVDYFIGLDARHARPEDVERLCCGAQRNEPQPGWIIVDAARCTLAIGHDGGHEDLARDVRRGAERPIDKATLDKIGALVFAEGFTSGGTVALTAAGETKTVRYRAGETDDALRARIREEAAAASVRRSLAGEPEPGTPAWIRAEVERLGWGCCVVPSSVGSSDVVVYGSTWGQCDGIRRHLYDGMPLAAHVHVNAAKCPGCGCGGLCEWRLSAEEDPEAVTCKTCQCRWCGPRKETGPTWTATATGCETTLRGYKVAVKSAGGPWQYEVSDWSGAVIGQRPTEREAKEHALRVVPKQPSSSPMFGPCAVAPDFKASTAWADAPAWADASGVVSAADLNAIPETLTFTRADIPEATTWSVVAFEEAYPPPLNLTPQAAAIRSAMAAIDALPWSAADKRALRDAAHAVCEMVEATDGKAPATLRGPVTEMLAALATAAHVGPAVVNDAELARGAAALMMPKRRKK